MQARSRSTRMQGWGGRESKLPEPQHVIRIVGQWLARKPGGGIQCRRGLRAGGCGRPTCLCHGGGEDAAPSSRGMQTRFRTTVAAAAGGDPWCNSHGHDSGWVPPVQSHAVISAATQSQAVGDAPSKTPLARSWKAIAAQTNTTSPRRLAWNERLVLMQFRFLMGASGAIVRRKNKPFRKNHRNIHLFGRDCQFLSGRQS